MSEKVSPRLHSHHTAMWRMSGDWHLTESSIATKRQQWNRLNDVENLNGARVKLLALTLWGIVVLLLHQTAKRILGMPKLSRTTLLFVLDSAANLRLHGNNEEDVVCRWIAWHSTACICIQLPLEERHIYRSNRDIQYKRHHSYEQAKRSSFANVKMVPSHCRGNIREAGSTPVGL